MQVKLQTVKIMKNYYYHNYFINIDIFNKDNVKKSAQDKILMIDQIKKDYTNEIDHKKNKLKTKAELFFADYRNNNTIGDTAKMMKILGFRVEVKLVQNSVTHRVLR